MDHSCSELSSEKYQKHFYFGGLIVYNDHSICAWKFVGQLIMTLIKLPTDIYTSHQIWWDANNKKKLCGCS